MKHIIKVQILIAIHKMRYFWGFFVLSAILTKSSLAKKVLLPSLVKTCSSKDPNLNDCVVKTANKLLPILVKGVKDWGLPVLDPMVLPRMDIGSDNGPVSIKFILRNTTQTGLSRLMFRSAQMDLKNGHWVLNGTMSQFKVSGQYVGRGRILVLPIAGEGQAEIETYNTTFSIVLDGTPPRHKERFFTVRTLRLTMRFGDTLTTLSNLFNGNKALGEQMTRFLHENRKEITAYLLPSLEDVYSDLFIQLVRKLTDNVPYTHLFSDPS